MSKTISLIEKLQNFRLLPFFVLISMAVGIGIGKMHSISDFELTPPINAIVAIFKGTYTFSLANTLGLFLHFWGVDEPEKLAQGLRAALDKTNSAKKNK